MASSTMSPVSDSQDQEFKNKAMDSKIRTGLEEMRLTRMFCDITLVAGNVDIPAHKNILASSSPYFLALLHGDFMENNGSSISIKDVNPDILTLLVKYIYTSRIVITEDNVVNIFIFSKMLQFWEVTKACSQFIKNQIQPDNCLGIKAFAKAQDDTDLISSFTDSYIFQHFAEVVKQEEFLELNKEDLIDFIASDKIVLESEDQVLDCILSWINKDRDSRSQYFPEFMKHFRFPFLSSDYLVTKVLNEPIMNQNNICKDSITKLLFDRLLKKDSSPILESPCSKPRQYLPNAMLVIGGWSGSNSLQSVECFDFKENQWSSLCEMPDSRDYCGGAVVGGKVYVVGGRDRNRVSTNSVYMYDPSVDTWTKSIPNMHIRRRDLWVAMLNDFINAVWEERMPRE